MGVDGCLHRKARDITKEKQMLLKLRRDSMSKHLAEVKDEKTYLDFLEEQSAKKKQEEEVTRGNKELFRSFVRKGKPSRPTGEKRVGGVGGVGGFRGRGVVIVKGGGNEDLDLNLALSKETELGIETHPGLAVCLSLHQSQPEHKNLSSGMYGNGLIKREVSDFLTFTLSQKGVQDRVNSMAPLCDTTRAMYHKKSKI